MRASNLGSSSVETSLLYIFNEFGDSPGRFLTGRKQFLVHDGYTSAETA